jgi:hypothetical protein
MCRCTLIRQYGNHLKLIMTFLHSRNYSQIELSPKELLEISQEINREFAPSSVMDSPELDAEIKLSPKELFDISEEIRQDFAPRASDNPQELVLLPVDPDHLYAYWNLGEDKPDTTPTIDSGNQLTLRIHSEPNKNSDITETKSWFDVAVDSPQAQQQVFLPMRTDETAYSATIGKHYPDNSLAPFFQSNITHVPPGKVIPEEFKESQKESKPEFKAMPQTMIAKREISHYMNNNASGQRIN